MCIVLLSSAYKPRHEVEPRPLFPSYLFVTTSPEQQRWRSISSTTGISHLLCDERGPVPVKPGVVEDIQKSEDERGLLQAIRFRLKGEPKCKLRQEHFLNIQGLLNCASDDDRVVLLINLLGRQIKAQIHRNAITALA